MPSQTEWYLGIRSEKVAVRWPWETDPLHDTKEMGLGGALLGGAVGTSLGALEGSDRIGDLLSDIPRGKSKWSRLASGALGGLGHIGGGAMLGAGGGVLGGGLFGGSYGAGKDILHAMD